jgi:oligosaccharide repeat unit polymerase
MPAISVICFSIFITLFISGLRKTADFLSPARIFVMLWAFVLGVVQLKQSHLQLLWTSSDWFVALLALVTFLLGIYISFIINLNRPFLHVTKIRQSIRESGINEKNLFRFIIVYTVIYIFCFIAEWQIEGYLPIFTSDPDRARILFGVFGLHLIVSSANVLLFLVIQYFIFVKANYRKKGILIFVFILGLANYILIVQRYGFVILLMMAFCLFYYSGKRIKPRTIISFSLIVLVVIIGIQSLRVTGLFTYYVYTNSEMKFSPAYAELTIPYMYLSMNIENFVKYYPKIENFAYGFFTFDFLTALTGIKHWVAEYANLEKFRMYIGGYNTYPFFWPYYLDFGIAGLAVIPFAIGFIISEVYYYLHRNPSLVVLTLATVGFAVIMISFNSDPLTRLDMMFNFTVIVLAQFLFVNKSFGTQSA